MEFSNLTPFPSAAFDSLYQHDQRFHTVVMRITFELRDDGKLVLAQTQTPLATADEFYGEANRSSVKQESDFAPYKPHTDVIVIADAYAPQGRPSKRFVVALKINDAPNAPDLPPEPYGLSPMQRASHEQLTAWRQECAELRAKALEGAVILRKALVIRGAREWRKRYPLTRALSMLTLPQWKLTAPQNVITLPLRYENAFGGENRVLVTERAAKRVGKKYRLSGRVPRDAADSDGEPEAIAHSVYEQNSVGCGFAERWYLRAVNAARLPAPQIEAPDEPVSRFDGAYTPRGFGVVGRAWKPRMALAGTYDTQWQERGHPKLPTDFDFAYWNCAPADQQVTPHLNGDETIMLCNLCPAGAETVQDDSGNTCLSFALPGHLPFVLVRFMDGQIGELAARLDTLIIDSTPDATDPDKKISVVCVWRATVVTIPAVRVLEARMIGHADVVAMREQAKKPKPPPPPRLAIVPNQKPSPTV